LKRLLGLISLGVVLSALFGCSQKTYTVDYNGNKELFSGAKDSYAPGEKVEITLPDPDREKSYSFSLDGELIIPEYSEEKGYVISFTMPSHNVSFDTKWEYEMIPVSVVYLIKDETESSENGVYMVSENFDNNELTFRIVNHGDEEVWYGEGYSLMIKNGDEYIPLTPSEKVSFIAIAYVLLPGEETTMTHSMYMYGKLGAGDYRLTKGSSLSLDFSLDEDWTE